MLRKLGRIGLGVVLTSLVWTHRVKGEAIALPATVQAGLPAKPLTIGLVAGAAVLELGGKRHALPLDKVDQAQVENVPLAAGGAINVLRLKGAQGEWVLLLGGKTGTDVLFSGRSDLHGDPGERTAAIVEIEKSADGTHKVSTGTRHEAISLCGGRAVVFERSDVDAKSLRLNPAKEPFALGGSSAELSPASTPESSKTVLRALAPIGSSKLGMGGSVVPEPPRALIDGDENTSWTFDTSPDAFAVMRWDARAFPIESLEIIAPALPNKLPSGMTILADDGRSFHVKLNAERVQQVVLPTPVQTRCLALVIDHDAKAKTPGAIAELKALTEADREGGVDRLIALLVQNDPRAEEATSMLAALDGQAALRVAARYDELDARGKQRALRILGHHLDVVEVRERVLAAARADEAQAQVALAVLKRGGAPGLVGLRDLAKDATAMGDEAARVLSYGRGESLPLLYALATQEGPNRPALRRALAFVARREAAAFEAALEAWLKEQPSVAARVALALALSTTGEHAATALAVALPTLSEASDFVERYRLALLLERAAPSPDADVWLRAIASDAQEWMLRRAALDSLLVRNPAEGAQLARKLVADPYPRVRATAVLALNAAVTRPEVEALARTDAWPVVREAAVRVLSDAPQSREVVRQAIDDTSRRVRATAIDGLARNKDREAWPLVRERLKAVGEWPEVHAAAVRYAGALCVAEAREPLTFVLRSSLKPNATEDEAVLGALAYESLTALGGEARDDAKKLAARDTAPAALRRAASAAPSVPCTSPPASAAK